MVLCSTWTTLHQLFSSAPQVSSTSYLSICCASPSGDFLQRNDGHLIASLPLAGCGMPRRGRSCKRPIQFFHWKFPSTTSNATTAPTPDPEVMFASLAQQDALDGCTCMKLEPFVLLAFFVLFQGIFWSSRFDNRNGTICLFGFFSPIL